MDNVSRREFQHQTLGALLTWSLLDTLFAREAFADEVKLVTQQWLRELHTMSLDLRAAQLDQLVWKKQVEELFSRVDLPDLLKSIDFAKLTQDVKFKERGELSLRPKLPQVEGLPTNLVFGHQVFALQKDRSVVPHGHDNMATAFLILQGDFHGRHYDRLEDVGKEHMIIQPTLDKQFTAGGWSTVTDIKDNVHWFQATSEVGYIFNIHVMSVKPGRSGRVYVDPNGEKLSGERIKARVINHDEANKLYG